MAQTTREEAGQTHPREPTAPPAGQSEGAGPRAGQAPMREKTQMELQMETVAEERRVLLEAEAKGASLPAPGSAQIGAMTGEQAAKAADEKTVKMVFPHAFTLAKEDLTAIHFQTGIQDVPESVKDHPYLKAQGARPV